MVGLAVTTSHAERLARPASSRTEELAVTSSHVKGLVVLAIDLDWLLVWSSVNCSFRGLSAPN